MAKFMVMLALILLSAVQAGADELVPPNDVATPAERKKAPPPWETVGSEPKPLSTPAAVPNSLKKAEASDKSLRWFINVGLGYGYIAYDTLYQSIANSQAATNGTALAIASDLGFYVSLISPNTLTGISGHGMTDIHVGSSASSSGGSSSSTNVSLPFIIQSNIAASVMQFFGADQATGLFLRADAGYVAVEAGTSASFTNYSSTSSGLGLLGGLGWAFGLGRHVRLLASGQASTILFLPDNPLSSFHGDLSVVVAF